MIGSLNPQHSQVNIVGAGISGLLAGYALKKKGFAVTIYEASSRVGGLIQTKKTPFGIAETGPHSLLLNSSGQALFEELQLPWVELHPQSRARTIFRNGKMRKLPLTLPELFSTVLTALQKPKSTFDFENETLEAWGHRYLGKAATRFLLGPFISGIYACSPHEINASLAFPDLIEITRNHSLIRGVLAHRKKATTRPKMVALTRGMESLVEALAEKMKGSIRLNTLVTDLKLFKNNLILTLPTAPLSALLGTLDPESAQFLSKVTYAPLITCTVFFRRSDFKIPPQGVGVLIPKNEGFRILGCLFNSSSFHDFQSIRIHEPDFISLSVMLGGTSNPNFIDFSDAELKNFITQDLQVLFTINSQPFHFEITRWPRAIPIYSNELKMALKSLKNNFCSTSGRIVFGNFTGKVSLRGLIESSQEL